MKALDSLPELRNLLDIRWHALLEPSFHILDELDKLLDFKSNIPNREKIFAAFQCDPKDVKVVIFGQDPYPNPKHAMGLSFSIPPDVKTLPGSLRNIYKEMLDDVGGIIPKNGDLSYLANQGVMLLNRGLSISLPDKLVNPYWYQFSDDVAQVLGKLGVIGVFWGNQAHHLSRFFPEERRILSAHPSPLSAHRGFFGSKHFSRVNAILSKENREQIFWTSK